MLDSIIRFSIRNKLIIGLLTLVLIGSGSYALRHLPINALLEGAIVQSGNQSQIFVLEEKKGQGEGVRYRFRPIPVRIGMAENGY